MSTLAEFLDWLEEARTHGPVHHDAGQGVWQVVGHPEVSEILADPGTYSSDMSEIMPVQDDFTTFQQGNFVRMDPPRHRKLRGIVSQAFTPRVVAGLEPRIAEVTTELLDAVDGHDRIDLIEALAYPLPIIVIAELLGIPTADRGIFRRWADVLFDQTAIDPEDSILEAGQKSMARVAPTIREMNSYLLDYIRSRRAHPGDDLTTRLTTAEVDGERLDDQQIIGFVGLLLLAGHITTTATLGNTIVGLDENPDAFAEVRADPGLLPATIEESIRFRTPFPRLARLTTRPARLGDTDLPAGAILQLWVTAANRDPRIFTDPNSFDIHRKPNPHLSFGHGIHFCLGAPLARLEAKIALRLLMQRYDDIALTPDAPPEFRNPFIMVSVNKLPLSVRPSNSAVLPTTAHPSRPQPSSTRA
ncbi:cytochrome P450 [Actinoplanes couchii]|uniref:Cytochrome P450 n=1 Tax=Actinoplanes couchii TaxID=403638 RepID=A0ABQ3XPN0_9ACTN|nr:cytochrome P450 [Actinoplanes couchii]MDR6319098.1 cytochrome P450 [Actinoplanes couchii]GID60439.1 cytochrome P450 [Actinoplanes couchii]